MSYAPVGDIFTMGGFLEFANYESYRFTDTKVNDIMLCTDHPEQNLIFGTNQSNVSALRISSNEVIMNYNAYVGQTLSLGTSNINNFRPPHKFVIMGPSNSLEGPNWAAYIKGDLSYPVYEQYNKNHDDINLSFDAYWSGKNWKSSSDKGNFQIKKNNGRLLFHSACNIPRGGILDNSWYTAMAINSNSFIGIGTSNPNHRLTLSAPSKSILGPHVSYYIDNDSQHPLVQHLNWDHDSIVHSFDAYWDSNNWVSSSSNGNFQVQKQNGRYMINSACNTTPGAILDNEWRNAFTVNSNSFIGIGTSNPTCRFTMLGENSSMNGPHTAAYTNTNSNHAIFQQLNWNSEYISQSYGAYKNSSNKWISSSSNGNFKTEKKGGRMMFFSAFNTSIGSNLDTSWKVAMTINSNSFVGIGTSNPTHRLTMMGYDSNYLGPHVAYTTLSDSNHPMFQHLNWTHDKIAMSFDSYSQSNLWKSSSSTGNFQQIKEHGQFHFKTAYGINPGNTINWKPALIINSNSFVGIGSSNTTNRITVTGNDSSVLGPHIVYYSDIDAYPITQQLNWHHDDIHIAFDAAYNGNNWVSSSATGNFNISKNNGRLILASTCNNAPGDTINWTNALSVNSNSFIGINTIDPTNRLTIEGPDANILGPHVAYYVDSDKSSPVFHHVNWAMNDIAMAFNSYWNGHDWISSSPTANFKIHNLKTQLTLFSACDALKGESVPWYNALSVNSNSYIGIGLSNPSHRLTVAGPSNDNFGPQMAFCFLEDLENPTLQIYNKDHDNITMNFDCVYDGNNYISSSSKGNFQIAKQNGQLLFQSVSSTLPGSAMSNWETSLSINSNSYVGINTTNPEYPLDVAGDALFRYDVYVNQKMLISDMFKVLGNSSFGSNIYVNQNAKINTLSNFGDASFSSNVYVMQNAMLNTLSNLGDANFSSNVYIEQTANVNILSNLGNADFLSNIYVNQTAFINTLSNLGNASFSSNVYVEKTATLNTLSNIGNASFNSNVLAINVCIQSNLTLSNTLSNLGDASFSSNVFINNNLYVNTLNSLGSANFSSNLIVKSNLHVTETSFINRLSNLGTADFNADVYINQNAFINNLSASNANISNLNIINTLSNLGNVSIASNLFVGATSTFSDTTVFLSNVVITGRLDLGSLNTLCNVGTPHFSGDVVFTSNVYIDQFTVLSNGLSNMGNASFSSNVVINSNLYVNQTAFVNYLVSSNIYVNDLITSNIMISDTNIYSLSNILNISTNLDVKGDINFSGLFYQNGIYFQGSRWSCNDTGIYISSNLGIGGLPQSNIQILSYGPIGFSNMSGTVILSSLDSNFGINNTNPMYALDANGDINFTGRLYENGLPFQGSKWSCNIVGIWVDSNVGINTMPTSNYSIDINGDVNFTGNLYQNDYLVTLAHEFIKDEYGIYTQSNMGIGTESTPSNILTIAGQISIDQGLMLRGIQITKNNGAMNNITQQITNIPGVSNTCNNVVFYNGLYMNGLRISSGTGITPTRVTDSNIQSSNLKFSIPSSNLIHAFRFITGSASNEVITMTGDGKIGIGTSNPSAALHIAGQNIILSNAVNPYMVIQNPSGTALIGVASFANTFSRDAIAGDCVINAFDGNKIILQSSNAGAGLCINTNNCVGIRNRAAAYALDVMGDINLTGILRQDGIEIPTFWFGSSNTIYAFNSNIGIGTASASEGLDVYSLNAKIGCNLYVMSNLGIGTSNPLYSLDVAGPINAITYCNLMINSLSNNSIYNVPTCLMLSNVYATSIFASNAGQSASNRCFNSFSNNSSNLFIIGSNVGIGASTPGSLLTIAGGCSIGTDYTNVIISSNMLIVQSNIGIGKSNPKFSLDIVGDINFTGMLRQGNLPYTDPVWTLNSSNVCMIGSNVGIGMLNPVYNLDVNGNINTSGNLHTNNIIALDNGGLSIKGGGIFITASNYISFNNSLQVDVVSSSVRLYPAPATGGSLGITGNTWTTVYATNGTIQTSDSSEKDYVPLSYGLENLLKIDTIKYKWKTQANMADEDPEKDHEYYGLIADQLNVLFPELVYNQSRPYQINYSELIPICINAIKDLKLILDEKNTRIDSLEARLEAIEAKLV